MQGLKSSGPRVSISRSGLFSFTKSSWRVNLFRATLAVIKSLRFRGPILIALAASLAIVAAPIAHAGDKERALIGGLIGGIIIGSAIEKSHHDRSYDRVVISNHHDHHARCGCSGHYEWVTTRVWIPVRYVWNRDSCGRSYRSREGGYYTYEKERVWVTDGHHDRRDNREYSYRDRRR